MRVHRPAVRHGTVDDFLDELRLDVREGLVHRNILRLTIQRIPNLARLVHTLTAFHVEASYAVMRGGVVRFARHMQPGLSESADDEAYAIYQALLDEGKAQGLDIRTGVFEDQQ